MSRPISFTILSAALVALCAMPAIAGHPKDGPVYRAANKYPVLDEITARRDSLAARRDSLIQIVRDRQQAVADTAKAHKRALRVDWTHIKRPSSPDDFRIKLPHLPPTPQFYTGTCWAFSSTSMMESEVIRLTGREVKLSEMWTVYWEYVMKIRRWAQQYGDSKVDEGSESEGLIEVYKNYGAVPREAYPGVLFADSRHDHEPLIEDLKAWLHMCRERNIWDQDEVIAGARLILDKHLGAPPETFEYDGRTWTPLDFRRDYLQLHPEDYVSLVSRMDTPFGRYCLLDVPDNWRRSANYLNVPLDRFYVTMKRCLESGYTFDMGGDNSEPGVDGYYDAAIIPSWDIPLDDIDQASREMRIVTGQTGDDHGIHVVGMTRKGGHDWFLIKDSNRSSRLGHFKGYYFWRGEYLRLKMLSIMVHKDMVKGLLPKE